MCDCSSLYRERRHRPRDWTRFRNSDGRNDNINCRFQFRLSMSLEHASAREKSGQSQLTYQTSALNLVRYVHAKFCKDQRRGHVEPPDEFCSLRIRKEPHRSDTVACGARCFTLIRLLLSNAMCEHKTKHQRSLALRVMRQPTFLRFNLASPSTALDSLTLEALPS